MVDRFRVGVIQAPFGVHGEARIFVTSDDPNRFLSLKAVHAAPPEREAAFSSRGAQECDLEILSARMSGSTAICAFRGIDTPEEVRRYRGMELWMISGDKREKAERIAGLLGIDNVLCEVKPSDKSDAVKKLQAKGKRVCFVGDGINDSPALACADIGVALGCGTDIAISSADVMIVGSGIDSVKTVFDVSAATMRNVRQNLIWAVVYNVICIPLAAAGIINPSIAAAAMALSSNGVLLNALRLKNYGK